MEKRLIGGYGGGPVLEKPLSILQVSTVDIHGGAEKVACDLFTAYRSRGHRSWLAVGEKRGNDPDVLLIPNQVLRGKWVRFWRHPAALSDPPRIWKRAAKPLSDLAIAFAEPARAFDILRGREDFYFPGSWRLMSLTPQFPHILHCHNLHGGYFDLRLVPFISQQVPVILTLHDAWLLSGHCAHSFACDKWQSGCGRCPDLTIYPAIRRDATVYNWQRKKEIYARSQLYVATPSQWLMKKVERSMLASAIVEARVIPNGVDLSVFRVSDKQKARAALDISQNAKVLFATGVMMKQNMWKDYSTLRRSLTLAAKRLLGQELVLIVLGEDTAPERLDGAEIRFVPYQQDPTTVAQYYQAADVYVHAAREDTFPTSVLEAMACGTPVVATAIGGIPEQVEDGRTGFLVSMGDAPGLANRITQLLSDESLRVHIGRQAAGTARRRFGFDQQIDEYLNWYAQLANHTSGVHSTEPAYALSNPT